HPTLSPARAAERLPPHPPLRPVRRRGSRSEHRARPTTARRDGECAPALVRRGRQSGRRRFACAPLPVLRRPDDRRRDVRRPAPRTIAIPEPDQDRLLMTHATHPASHRRSPPPPAARRNTSAMSAGGRQSSFDRCERLAPASKTAAVGASAENAERGPLPTPRSPAVRDPQIPIVALAKRPRPSRGFLLGRLSSAGPGRGPTVAKGRRPKPFTSAEVPISAELS